MAKFDCVVRGGMLVDGTGAPRVRADVGIRAGCVEEIGRLSASDGACEIDASGCVVAPGFVDLHTHYDAQIFWDPYCSISGWHGVTSVVIGNCGFGFAPVAADERERAMQSMTRVEAIPYEAMREGMPWDWESFPEFLDSLERTDKAVNVQALAPLTPIMVDAMGLERAKAGALPTDDEHARMQALLDEAMVAGAAGWSAQRTSPDSGYNIQRDYDGTAMVTDVMHDETMLAMAEVLARHGRGFVQTTCVKRTPQESFDIMERVVETSGRPLLHNVILAYANFPKAHHLYVDWVASCRERGLPIYGQAVTSTAGFTFDFHDWNLFDECDAWADATCGSDAEKLQKLGDPERRPLLRKQTPYTITPGLEHIVVVETRRAEHAGVRGRTLGELGEERGVHPVDVMLDLAVAEQLDTVFYTPLPNDGYFGLEDLLRDPSILCGVSDGGAHTKFTTPGIFPTELLTVAVRERGMVGLEEAHRRLSALPAHCAGMGDRGTLRPGAPADVIVYDLEHLEILEQEVVRDVPGGEWRRVQRARGYRHVLVNGTPTIEEDAELGVTPGRLLR